MNVSKCGTPTLSYVVISIVVLSKNCVNLSMHYVIILKTRVVLSIYNIDMPIHYLVMLKNHFTLSQREVILSKKHVKLSILYRHVILSTYGVDLSTRYFIMSKVYVIMLKFGSSCHKSNLSRRYVIMTYSRVVLSTQCRMHKCSGTTPHSWTRQHIDSTR